VNQWVRQEYVYEFDTDIDYADEYMASQLIMISHDLLAQFWEGFGHISYYRRVDLDALLRYTHST
jgi:hypothetical protein